jgi:arsenate reductase
MDATIYHNPRCSTSRKALDLLREAGIEPTVVEYLKDPPSRTRLKQLIKAAGVPVREAIRNKEPLYAELGLGGPEAVGRQAARRDGREPDPDRAADRGDAQGRALCRPLESVNEILAGKMGSDSLFSFESRS